MDRSLSFSSRIRKIAGTAAIMALAFTACTQGDELSHKPGGDTPGLLTITVSDGGYAEDGTPTTRTVENGYRTRFQAGDSIGVFVERTTDGGATHTCENVKITYDGAAWIGPLYYYTTKDASHSVTYTAYYPYRDAGFADGADFQAWVDGFTPPTDQSTHARYTAADLMTATGTVTDGNSISFRLVHRMALCVAELPVTKYTLTDAGGNSLPDYYIPVPGIQFNGFRPYHHTEGEYRYLLKPGTATLLSGSYRDDAGATKEYTLDASGITASGYKCYKIDGGVTTKTHTLQAGDYYMKDGSLVAGTTALSDEQKSDVLGIVFWAGNPTNTVSGDPALRREHPHCTHGLVVALKDASASTPWQTAWTDIKSWMNANPTGYENIATGRGDNDNLQRIRGYNNTKAINLYNEYCNNQGGMDDNKVLPVQYIEAYARNNPAPAGSSGWYLPSPKELSTLCSGWFDGNIWKIDKVLSLEERLVNRNLINNRLTALGNGVAGEISPKYYWSCSESADDPDITFSLYFNSGWVSGTSKGYNLTRMRPVLAF